MRPRPITGRGRFLFRILRNKTIDVHLAVRKIVALQHRSGTQNSQANSDIEQEEMNHVQQGRHQHELRGQREAD